MGRSTSWRTGHGCLPVRRTTPTLGEYLDRWLEVTRRRVRPSTIENHELNVARITAYLGDLPLTRLNPPKIPGHVRPTQR